MGDESVAIIGQHLNTPPVAPSWHNPECPQPLEALILRMLEKNSSNRPASASEVHAALESIDLSKGQDTAETDTPTVTPVQNPIYNRTFVGRESEMRQLESAFDNALSGVGSLSPVISKTAPVVLSVISNTAITEPFLS